MKHLAWADIEPDIRAEMRESMLEQLKARLVRLLRRAPARRDVDRVSRLERAIDAAERLP